MNATVIDTLKYADRLKDAGVEHRQAEAMSRALNDELTGGVATKEDLARAVVELKTEITKVDAKFDAMDEKFETQGRYVFLVLALIAALGLYNAVAPRFFANEPTASDPKSTVATTAAQTPRPPAKAPWAPSNAVDARGIVGHGRRAPGRVGMCSDRERGDGR